MSLVTDKQQHIQLHSKVIEKWKKYKNSAFALTRWNTMTFINIETTIIELN